MKFREESPIDVQMIHVRYVSIDSLKNDTVRFELEIINGSDSIVGRLTQFSEQKLIYTRRISKRHLGEIYKMCLKQTRVMAPDEGGSSIKIKNKNGESDYFVLNETKVFEDYFNRLFKLDR